ncbi:MAG: hypothetical protein R3D68_05320 [Hyphomicrobiaceae bacterium]
MTIECHRSKGASRKWHDVIERILASAQLRAPVSLDQFFAEHRFKLGDTGLFATHFGVQLHLTPVRPVAPADAWRRTRIQVNAPVDDDDNDPPRRALDDERETRIGDVRWFIRTEPLSLPDGSLVQTATAIAHGRTVVVFVKFDESSSSTILKGLGRVVQTLRIQPREAP